MTRQVLSWGIRTSFRRYVAALPDGWCGVDAGAVLLGAGQFGFPVSRARVGPAGGDVEARGVVAFGGHHGMLSVLIENPRAVWSGTSGSLLVGPEDERGAIASLSLPGPAGDDRTRAAFDVCLAPEGVSLFGGSYAAGEPLDPLLLTATDRLLETATS